MPAPVAGDLERPGKIPTYFITTNDSMVKHTLQYGVYNHSGVL